MPLTLPLPLLIQIDKVCAWPTPGSATKPIIEAAVAPTIQRHANFKEAGMLTPSIFFCPLAVPRSANELIHPLPQPLYATAGGVKVIHRPPHIEGGGVRPEL
jgi:hypothetical protein